MELGVEGCGADLWSKKEKENSRMDNCTYFS